MSSTEQHPIDEVGSTVLPVPFVDVMCLALAGWPMAAGNPASTVSFGEGNPLALGE